jgi:hypothetical protein
MFRGKYQFVAVDIDPVSPHHGAGRVIRIRTLDEKLAANPTTVVGVIVDLDNSIDRILVVGDDAYTMGKIPMEPDEGSQPNGFHKWYGKEGYGRYYGYIKPAGTAKIIMDMLEVDEK